MDGGMGAKKRDPGTPPTKRLPRLGIKVNKAGLNGQGPAGERARVTRMRAGRQADKQ